jgi:hypothetical protein
MKHNALCLAALLIVLGHAVLAQPAALKPPAPESLVVPTAAVLPFDTRKRDAEYNKAGKTVAELLFVKLLESGAVDLVERAELDKALDELHLSAVGMAAPEARLEVGPSGGAKLLITGSVFEVGEQKYAVAKVIGTETSRVLGCSVTGTGEFADLVPPLAEKVVAILTKDAARLLPRKATVFSAADRLSAIQGKGRKVHLTIKETIQSQSPDPAAAIALQKLLLALDFQVVQKRADADFAITCEAIASPAGSYQKFSSAAARVELSVTRVKDNRLLSANARKETIAGATYLIAAKDAIQQATLKLAADTLNCLK